MGVNEFFYGVSCWLHPWLQIRHILSPHESLSTSLRQIIEKRALFFVRFLLQSRFYSVLDHLNLFFPICTLGVIQVELSEVSQRFDSIWDLLLKQEHLLNQITQVCLLELADFIKAKPALIEKLQQVLVAILLVIQQKCLKFCDFVDDLLGARFCRLVTVVGAVAETHWSAELTGVPFG